MLLSHNIIPTRRKFSTLISFALIFSLVYLIRAGNYGEAALNYLSSASNTTVPTSFLQDQQFFWQQFYNDLTVHGPRTTPLKHPEDTHLDVFFNKSIVRTRPDLLKLTDSQLSALRDAHSTFRRTIQNPDRLYKVPYKPGTKGIVTTAGGAYLRVALVSIRLLRETGSKLPVEVWLATWDEFDRDICGSALPKLNAQCQVLEDMFTSADQEQGQKSENEKLDKIKKMGITKYQYKSLAILFSSYEQLVFLDSDSFPVHDPQKLFESPPFEATGLVLWPDFWSPSESPRFFDIVGISKIDIPALNFRPSTESGQMVYDKSKHAESIMLAMYYNFYGPDYYYPLQSQGAPGEGDKETFLWSAIALQQPLYTIKSPVKALGYITKSGDWRGSAMSQSNPTEDFNMHTGSSQLAITDTEKLKQQQEAENAAAAAASSSSSSDSKDSDEHKLDAEKYGADQTRASPFFIHANFPKLDPLQIFERESFGAKGPTRDSDGTARRMWHETAQIAEQIYGFDVEKRVWSVMKDLTCGDFGARKSGQAWRMACLRTEAYFKFVFDK